MKYILILLTFAFGQTPQDTIFVRDITNLDLFEYAEYCYNDSVEDYIHLTPYGFGCLIGAHGGCLSSVHKDSSYYGHPTPTFSGFIEWIRSKQ